MAIFSSSAASPSTTTARAAQTGSSNSTSNSAITGLSTNYKMFLSILTTQMRHQNPLNPMDSSKYTEQLVQFSSVEQQIKTNDQLVALLKGIQTTNASAYVNYIGRNITATGSQSQLSEGRAVWNYVSDKAASGKIEIRDIRGALVFSEDTSLARGQGTYEWNGRMTNGGQAADGAYNISIKAYGADGSSTQTVPTRISGKVGRIDYSGATPLLVVNGQTIALSAVTSVKEEGSAAGS